MSVWIIPTLEEDNCEFQTLFNDLDLTGYSTLNNLETLIASQINST
jgi:hypothetical protein